MAELTTLEALEEKLAEVLGLAQAARGATEKVEGMVEDEEIVASLKQMREEAEETEQRCTEVADSRDGKMTAILEKAQETKSEATDMMSTYLGGDSDGLDVRGRSCFGAASAWVDRCHAAGEESGN